MIGFLQQELKPTIEQVVAFVGQAFNVEGPRGADQRSCPMSTHIAKKEEKKREGTGKRERDWEGGRRKRDWESEDKEGIRNGAIV